MRAILAILKDAFREALASRVLWMALGAILLVLLALSPMSLNSVISTQLRPYELADTEAFLKQLAEGSTAAGGPAKHLWGLLTEDQRTQVRQWLRDDSAQGRQARRIQSSVVNTVNSVIGLEKFYVPEAWESPQWQQAELPEELRSVAASESDPTTRASANLKRLAAAFPEAISIQDNTALVLYYGSLKVFGPLRLPPAQIETLINEIIIGVLAIFLGFFGVFASLLVTASVIPRTFEPGEISLLLSKPVPRSVIYLTRFLGGCLFTFVCAGTLVTGTFLLLWARFDIWRPVLVACIPLYVFLFAIYYSVSALAGAIWRNPVVSLILVVVFWIVQVTVSVVNNFMTAAWLPGRQLEDVVITDSQVFATDGSRNFLRWNTDSGDWQPMLEDPSPNPMQVLGIFTAGARPRITAAADGQSVLAMQPEFSRFNQAGPARIFRGEAADNFVRSGGSTTPEPVFGIYQARDGRVILPGTRSVHLLKEAPEDIRNARSFLRDMLGGLIPAGSSGGFEVLSPGVKLGLRPDASVAWNPADESFVCRDRSQLLVLSPTAEGKYVEANRVTLDRERPALLAAGGSAVIMAEADGRIEVLNQATLEVIATGRIPDGDKPRRIEMSPDGSRAAVLTHAGVLVMYHAEGGVFSELAISTPRMLSGIRFLDANRLAVAAGRTLMEVNPATGAVLKSWQGQVQWPVHLYDYVVRPLHAILPRPGDLDNTVRYLVTGESSMIVEDEDAPPSQDDDLSAPRIVFNPWSAFTTNSVFLAVLLLLGCLYISRSDF
jgi:ABC-type transport system involved in multi-copper enzyme maturation permease subunit